MGGRKFLFIVAFLSLSVWPGVAGESTSARNEARPAFHFPDAHSEFARSIGAQLEKYLSASDEERDENEPLAVYGDQLIDLARDDSSKELSFFASGYLIRWGRGEAGDRYYGHLMAGFDGILRYHKDNPHLTADLAKEIIGCGGDPESEIEAFYRRLLDESGNRTVRAAAAFELAVYLDELADMIQIRSDITSDRLRDHLASRDVAELREEADRLLRMVIEDYADERPSVREPCAWYAMPARYTLDADGPSYGEKAERLLFAIRHLRAGCQAPDIVGRDASGREFRLSDYRGNVILLMFSFKGCGSCEAMYPVNRGLLEKFADAPFVVLGVMASFTEDETVQTLQEAMEEGRITWRCWWDGYDRKISTRWNVTGWPSPYLIDAQGVIQRFPGRGEAKLTDAIANLLEDTDDLGDE